VSRELPPSADFVILGAGVMGASIAFHLARRQAGRIVVLDKGDVAHGGSGRSSALVRMHYSFPPEVDLAVKSLEIFRTWPDYVGRRGDFRQTGFVRTVPEKELPRLEKNVAMQRAHGVDARVVDRAELADIVPDWNVDDVPYAAWEPGSGYGDGTGVATDFLERAREMGVVYRSATRVERFCRDGGRVTGVVTDAGPVAAPVVVAAVGPWSRPLFAGVGFDLPVEGPFVIGVSALGPSGNKSDYSDYGVEQISVSAPGGYFRDGFGTPTFRTNGNQVLSTYPLHVLQAQGRNAQRGDGGRVPDVAAAGAVHQTDLLAEGHLGQDLGHALRHGGGGPDPGAGGVRGQRSGGGGWGQRGDGKTRGCG